MSAAGCKQAFSWTNWEGRSMTCAQCLKGPETHAKVKQSYNECNDMTYKCVEKREYSKGN